MFEGSPRILIVRLSAIGDVVRVMPTVHALREFFPRARIDWAVESKSASLLKGHPSLDDVIIFERSPQHGKSTRAFIRFLRDIRGNRYDIVIDFHGTLKSGLVTAFSRARERYGFARPRAREGSYFFTNHKVKLPSSDLNRLEENALLIEPLAPAPDSGKFSIAVPQDIHDSMDDVFDEMFAGGKLVVAMHVPIERAEKRWPKEKFAALADMLLADGRFEVMLTHGPNQREAVDEVIALTRRKPVVAPDTGDLRGLAWLLHRCDLYFGGDTGPMHIAAAMGTAVVAVFGGTSPRKHKPSQVPCITLGGAEAGKTGAEILAEITPEMAYDACVEMVSHGRGVTEETE
jgi:lipopolysaccharide heptosyltransferase I